MPRRLAHWNREFDRLSTKSDAEIYRELSLKLQLRSMRPGKAYAARGDESHGRSWLELKLEALQSHICNNKKLRDLLRDNYTERDLFIVLVDILSGLSFYVPLGTIAMILARGGLKKLCPELRARLK